MPRLINLNRDVVTAFTLGMAALVSNMFAMSLSDGTDFLPVGNILLYLSASALGVPGALISCAIGAAWDIWLTGSAYEFLRLTFCCVAIGHAAKRFPKIPPFAVALGLWLTLFAPLAFFASAIGKTSAELNIKSLSATGIVEVVEVMIAGVILLNSRIWTLITNAPRRANISGLLIHVITSVTAISMFAVASVLIGSSSFTLDLNSKSGNSGGLISVFLLGIILPSLIAWRLGSRLINNFQELFPEGFLGHAGTKSFSGLSSEYWRRQSSPNISREQLGGRPENQQPGDKESAPESQRKVISPEQGLCAMNRNGTVTFMNRKFKKFCEVTSNEVLGKNIAGLSINQVILKRLLTMVEETFTKGPRTSEVKINQLPDKLRFYEICTYRSDAFEDSSIINGPDSIIIIVKDISERRTIQSHILQSQKLESLGILVEGIAHTFNNSLTTIAGQASFAKRTNDRAQVEKSLNEILKTAFSAGTVVRQLLEFASGRPNRMKDENLVEVMEERLDLLKRIAGENQEIKIESTQPEIGVSCDTNLIMQAVTNLVLNSKEAGRSNQGQILISVGVEEVDDEVANLHPGTRPGSFARLRVKDSGHGMSMDVLAKAFDPLFTTKSASGHTGLGLAIVFAIVRAHDGFLTAESQVEKGTSISMYFPLQELSSDRRKQNTVYENRDSKEVLSNNPELMGNEEKILVVEDEESLRSLVSTMLSTLNYKVDVCADGQQALEKARTDKFDLVLTDMMLPKIKGLDLIQMLKKDNICNQALIMTACASGINGSEPNLTVIHKPFDLDTLAKAVKSSLKKP